MLRAAAWTGGLFGAGAALCRVFPAGWVEPVVLFALGSAMLVVSSRSGRPRRTRGALAPKGIAA